MNIRNGKYWVVAGWLHAAAFMYAACLPSVLQGQVTAGSHARACEVAEATVKRSSTDRAAIGRGYRELQRCAAKAAPVLAGGWQNIPVDAQELTGLLAATRAVRDARVLSAVQRAALDRSLSTSARRAALAALEVYADSKLVALALPAGPAGTAPEITVAATADGAAVQLGPQPFSDADARRVLGEVLRVLAAEPRGGALRAQAAAMLDAYRPPV